VELLDVRLLSQRSNVHPPLFQYAIQVGAFYRVVFSDPFVATTISTKLLAIGEVNIKIDHPLLLIGYPDTI
jgi:hypothetical protein